MIADDLTRALFAAFAFRIPLWYVGCGYWIAYGVTYPVITGVNIHSHRKT